MLRRSAASRLWVRANRQHAHAEEEAFRDPRAAQHAALRRFLDRNADSEYGRRHGYRGIRSIEEFQARVPVVDYHDLEPWIARAVAGEGNVLTTEPVIAVEPTSGSSGGTKLVPITRALLDEFRRGVGAWLYHLFAGRPELLAGSHYWSITPMHASATAIDAAVPVGLGDLDYFGALSRHCLERLIELPPSEALASDIDRCVQETARHLATCRDLAFISVWCPSLLILLAEALPAGVTPAAAWPNLAQSSCWTSAHSRRHLPRLRELFPDVPIQGKGLLATEGIVSYPVWEGPPRLALTSHFLEFLDADGVPHLVDELEVGARYSVLLTTGGGFARYHIGDVVEACGKGRVEFVGREGGVSDLCGEKLTEEFCRTIVEDAAREFGLRSVPFLAPEWGTPPRYLVFVEGGDTGAIARWVDRRIRRSYHYDYCRTLGQLGPIEGVPVENVTRRYLRGCESLGQRAGTAKSLGLRREEGWRERMTTAGRSVPYGRA